MIYLDYCATGAPFESVLSLFKEISKNNFGNPSSLHFYGYESKKILEEARNSILSILKVDKEDNLIFTSGATEANNLALKGLALKYQNRGKKIITSEGEHPSILNPLRQLHDLFGFDIVYLKLNQDGVINLEDLKKAIDKDTILVSIMGVNNETGAISPLQEIAKIVKEYPKCFFHSDLTQAIGKIDLDYSIFDLFSFSAHKIGGLKGSGALIYKKKIQFIPLISGGEQEFSLRSGTSDVASDACLFEAIKVTFNYLKERKSYVESIHSYLIEKLEEIPSIVINSPSNSSPFLTSISLLENKASVVVEGLSNKKICVSSVSACSSKGEPSSYVLLSMGKSERLAHNPIRISISFFTTKEEIDTFIFELKSLLKETKSI
ncbi:MAG TPA: cysteine desulfurase NifS [Firmicutes bacterium]|nr:cysteine desulfurase NifS [Bacillota bacterium]